MRKSASEWTVKMLVDLESRINADAEYQRGAVWSEAQQRLLVDSVLRGFDLPKVYLRKNSEGEKFLYEVVDGKQRLTAIWRFFRDEYRTSRSLLIEGLGEIGGKFWSEFPDAAQDRLQFATITVSVLEDASREEVSELFLRLQKGEPLKAAEKRAAIIGPVRDFVRDTLSHHRAFRSMGIPNRRYSWQELAAIALCIVRAGGPTSTRSADLTDLYELVDFDPMGPLGTKATEALDALALVAEARPGSIRTRWGFVDLLITLLRFQEAEVPWDGAAVMAAFVRFETERREATAQLADLRAELENVADSDLTGIESPNIDADMLAYVQAFAREGATLENVRVRSEVMYRRVLNGIRP